MKNIQEAVAAYLEQETAVRTVCDGTAVKGVYPLLAVAVAEKKTLLLAGGRQAEHTYEVTVTAVSDRERTGNTALLSGLVPVLLRGVPWETEVGARRVLHPLGIRTDEDRLTFRLELCVALPDGAPDGEGAPEPMQTLHFGV